MSKRFASICGISSRPRPTSMPMSAAGVSETISCTAPRGVDSIHGVGSKTRDEQRPVLGNDDAVELSVRQLSQNSERCARDTQAFRPCLTCTLHAATLRGVGRTLEGASRGQVEKLRG
jgi:hypothetical protein